MNKYFVAFVGFSCFFSTLMADPLVDAARLQIGKTLYYDSGYKKIDYPMGDVPLIRGVCSDVVIRAYRDADIDLQKLVHEDMKSNFSKYPKIWGMKTTDKNIDHRRVPNLQVFLERHAKVLAVSKDFKAGDIVIWNLRDKGSLPHIGIVSDKLNKNNFPFVIHNIGAGTVEEDVLFDYTITGHYRYKK